MRLRNIPGAEEEIRKSPWCIEEARPLAGRWNTVFANANPIHLEVGMGKGRFLMEMARLHPEIDYLGMELYDSVLLKALQRRQKREEAGEAFPNLYFLRMDARLLPEIFAPGEVGRIYLNFSDPWPKARHRSRRLPSCQFLARYEKILSPDGRLEFKTDNQELFSFALSEAEASGWRLLYETWDLYGEESPYENVSTEYEEKFHAQGNPICKLILGYPQRDGREEAPSPAEPGLR